MRLVIYESLYNRLRSFFLYALVFGFCVTAAGFGALFFITNYSVIDVSILERYDPGTPSVVLDCHGAEWARFQRDRR